MKTRHTILAGVAFALLAACSSGGGHSSSATSSAPATGPVTTDHITIKNFAFSPADAVVGAGSTVTVTNEDLAAHTLTDVGVFDSGVVAPNGGHMTFTAPAKPGSYAYICTIHPYMHGTLTVQ